MKYLNLFAAALCSIAFILDLSTGNYVWAAIQAFLVVTNVGFAVLG